MPEGTRFPNAIQIGTSAFVALATTVGFYVADIGEFRKGITTPAGLTSSGSFSFDSSSGAILVGGQITWGAGLVTCTATGGKIGTTTSTYDTCISGKPASYGISGTGRILDVILDMKFHPTGTGTLDCGFVKALKSGTAVTFIESVTIPGTGGVVKIWTGTNLLGQLWNSADYIKCGTSARVKPDAYMKLKLEELYSE